jgi:hypothetical protein
MNGGLLQVIVTHGVRIGSSILTNSLRPIFFQLAPAPAFERGGGWIGITLLVD